ncbi:SCO7613 C-terminal domain-containing membrane protein [Blastococcus sp. SYSU DS1024]
MTRPVGTAPLPYRARPPQVLLGVGAVVLVTAGAAVASASGGWAVRGLLLALAAAAAAGSVRAARERLRSSEESLAAAAAGLSVAALAPAGAVLAPSTAVGGGLTAAFLALRFLAPSTAAWPVAAWATLQLAVLGALDGLADGPRTDACLAVALVGLWTTVAARPAVARIALVTTAPWWLVGVVAGTTDVWAAAGTRQWLTAALVVGAAAGLLLARLRAPLERLLGPPRAVPVVAGAVAGAAVAGAFSSWGVVATTLTAYGGVVTANLAAATLHGWRRGLLLPAGVAGGVVTAALCVLRLLAAEAWPALSVLLLLTALPTAFVAARRRDDRPVALPTAVGCPAGSVLLALPADALTAPVAAVLLTALYGVAMTVGAGLAAESRRPTVRVAAVCALAAVLVPLAAGDRPVLGAHLAAQGLFTLWWAWRTGRRPEPVRPHARMHTDGSAAATAGTLQAGTGDAPPTEDEPPGRAPVAWRVGAGQLVAAVWVAAAAADLSAVEWYSLSAAAGLLLAAGPQLAHGRSWPAWGPGLLVAAVPSTAIAVVAPDGSRAVGVLVAAAALMVLGARRGVRTPLTVGAGSALAVAVGLTVPALPWPLGVALAVGSFLLAVGSLRERHPVPFFATRLADLR